MRLPRCPHPDAWEPYLAHITEAERGDLLSAYHRRLTSDDPAVRLAAARIWSGWEGATSKFWPDPAFAGHYEEDEFAAPDARRFAPRARPGDAYGARRRDLALAGWCVVIGAGSRPL